MSFQIIQKEDKVNNLKIVEIFNDTTFAKIILNQGGSLQELKLNSVDLINDLYPLQYKDTFASSILFPFVNRLENGQFLFEDKEYKVAINEKEKNNALHGFVFNKEFELINQNIQKNSASVTLEYKETQLTKGFPFTYTIQLTYIFNQDSLELKVNVLNTSEKTFPFTIGWHPYFTSSDLFTSKLKFDSSTKTIFNGKLIAIDKEEIQPVSEIEIKDSSLDDCYFLDSNKIEFKTPEYHLEINSSSENNFLQIYTPPKKNVIAIEPTIGISNSFNNKIGLQTLKPKEKFAIAWQLKLINHL